MVMTITAAVTATIMKTNTTATTTITTATTTTITATTTATETNHAAITNQNATIMIIINTRSGQTLAIDLLPTATKLTPATADVEVILTGVLQDQMADRVIITATTGTEHPQTATKTCLHASRK